MDNQEIVDTPYRIWPNYPASGLSGDSHDSRKIHRCARAGGGYIITMEAVSLLNHPDFQICTGLESERLRAKLTTILVCKRQHGEEFPYVTGELVKEARDRSRLAISDRADGLLRYLASREELFHPVTRINLEGNATSDEELFAMACSESTSLKAVNCLLDDLVERNHVITPESTCYLVTVGGRNYLKDRFSGV